MTRKISCFIALMLALPIALQAWNVIQPEEAFTSSQNGTLPVTMGADWDAGVDVKVVPISSAHITSGTTSISAPQPGGDGYAMQLADVGSGGYNFAWPASQTAKTANAVSVWSYLYFGAEVTWEQDYGVFLSSAADPTPLYGGVIYDQLQGYFLMITVNSSWGSYYPPNKTAFLLKRVDESGWIQVAEGKTAYDTGWHQLRLERDDAGRIQGFVDGKLEVSFVDSTPLPAGFPGMVFYNGHSTDVDIVGVFDNFRWEDPSTVRTLTQLWKKDINDSTIPWFNGADINRGMALSASGNLLVVDRDATYGDKIHRLNPSDGAEITPALTQYPGGFVGGNNVVSKVAASKDGAIYVCSLALATKDFRIYRYDNEDSTPTLAYSETAISRMGDCMRLTGTGLNTKLLVSGFGNPYVFQFTTSDGVNFAKTTETVTLPTLAGNYYVDYDVDRNSDFWARKIEGLGFTTTGTLYTKSAGTYSGARQTLGLNNSGPFAMDVMNGVPVMGLVPGAYNTGLTNVKASIYELGATNNQSPLLYELPGIEKTGGAAANGNATGEFVFDIPNNRVYILYTNNSISAFSLSTPPEPPSKVQDWNLFN